MRGSAFWQIHWPKTAHWKQCILMETSGLHSRVGVPSQRVCRVQAPNWKDLTSAAASIYLSSLRWSVTHHWRTLSSEVTDPLALDGVPFSPFSLENLCLHGSNIDDESASALATGLANNTTIKILDLGQNEHISSAGWLNFYNLLKNSSLALESLELIYTTTSTMQWLLQWWIHWVAWAHRRLLT